MEEIKLTVSVVAVLISIVSFVIARRSDVRTKKAEAIKNLLGEKETVAYAVGGALPGLLAVAAGERPAVHHSIESKAHYDREAEYRQRSGRSSHFRACAGTPPQPDRDTHREHAARRHAGERQICTRRRHKSEQQAGQCTERHARPARRPSQRRHRLRYRRSRRPNVYRERVHVGR